MDEDAHTREAAARVLSAMPQLIPAWCEDRDGAEAALAFILTGEDTPKTVEAAMRLLNLHSHHSREAGELTGLLCRWRPPVGPTVRGAVLRQAIEGGKMHSPLAIFPRAEVMKWLASASRLAAVVG
jgi:hypothetical protein